MTATHEAEFHLAPSSSEPAMAVPAGATDAHSHIFGPFDRFPSRLASVYPLPDAPPAVHAGMRRQLGVERAVLVQPAPYGQDPSAMLAAIAQAPDVLRGVAVASPEIDDEALALWKAGGIVGLRFVEMRAPGGTRYPGSVGFDALRALAPRMRALGLHAQLWASIDQYAEALPELAQLGLPLVLDHMGSPDPERGVDDPAFGQLLAHLRRDEIWVKLTLCRFFAAAPDYRDLRPFHDALIDAADDRLIWGSDWPYVRIAPPPDAGRMLTRFGEWTCDPGLRARILSTNPGRLYRFDSARGEE